MYSPRRYHYFNIAKGFARSNNPESYAGGSVAISRASHVGQVEGDDPDKNGYPSPLCWVLGVELTTPPHKIYVLLSSF
jgi:hypothetical protein